MTAKFPLFLVLLALLRPAHGVEFWQRHPPFRERLSELSSRAIALLDASPVTYPFTDAELLQRAHARFNEQKF